VLLRCLAALLAGVTLALAFEPVAAPIVIPFAVAIFVGAVRDLSPRRAWLPGLAFGVGFEFVLQWWMRAVGVDAWLSLSSLEASFFGVLGALVALLLRLRAWPLWVASAWVAVEAWRSSWPLGGMPWGRLAFASIDTPVAEAMPYVGAHGVSLLWALLGTCLAWVVLTVRARPVAALGTAAMVSAAIWLPGLAAYTTRPEGSVTLAVIQGNVPGDGSDILLDHRQVTRNHVVATQRLGADVNAGLEPVPDFVLWPENSTAVDPFADPGIAADIEAASQAVGVPILVGAMVNAEDPGGVLNQGIVWSPDAGAGDRYTKRHPVPFGEYIPWRGKGFTRNFGRLDLIPRDMLSGRRTQPLEIAGIPVADAICFDVAYDDGIAAQIKAGGEILVVQTSNATFIHTSQIRQQFAITRLRALETQRGVAVAATNGVSGVIDARGEVLREADPRTTAVLTAQLPLSSIVTPGVALGPWFARACVALTILCVVVALVPYRRPRQLAANDASASEPLPEFTGTAH
jgi:apolipoprotein N-acyltransferase